jgi:hypothetical protein
MPAGQYGQVYGQGVKYLKVNRYDSGGLDRSDYLGQLTNLTINYDDLGPIQYNIITTQEQDTYFVYGIQTRFQNTSSVNFNILSSSITIQDTSSFNTNIDAPTYVGVDIAGFYTVLSGNANLLGSFGSYKVPRTPNIQLSLTISASYTNSSGFAADTKLSYGTYNDDSGQTSTIGVSGVTSIPNGASGVLAYKWDDFGSTILEDNLFNAKVFGITTTNSNLNISNFKVIISQSQAPNFSYPTLTIFEPEFIDWDYNDYNALFGNAETPQFSTTFMDVDYTSNYTTPVNFELIISGTADRALVQDSNYNSYTWSALRYWGSRYNSYTSNNYTPQNKPQFIRLGGNTTTNIGNFNDPSLDGSGYGELPAVEQNQTFIAYFDGVGGTGPEIIGQTAYFIKYLIDTNGNVSNPEPGVSALYNLIDNFEPGKNAVVRLIGSDPTLTANPNDDALTGLYKITHVGRVTPIILSQNGSGSLDYNISMSFALLGDILNPLDVGVLTSKFYRSSPIFISEPLEYTNFDFQSTQYSNNNSWTRTTGGSPTSASYILNTSSIEAGTRIRFNTQFHIQRIGTTSGIDTNFKYRIIKNNNTDNVFYESDWFSVPYDNNISLLKQSTTPWFNAEENDVFKVQIKYSNEINPNSNLVYPRIQSSFNTYFMVEQETPPLNDFISGVNTVTSSYWSVGDYSGATTVLTASEALFNIYQQQGVYQLSPTESLQFGFSPISTAFYPILPGDYIRFEYIPDAVYNITNVTTIPEDSDQSASLFLTTVPPITSGSNLDNFVLYRVVNDGTYVVLDVNKPIAGNSFTGIIQPEYMSQESTNNYNNIIQDLTQRGVIS